MAASIRGFSVGVQKSSTSAVRSGGRHLRRLGWTRGPPWPVSVCGRRVHGGAVDPHGQRGCSQQYGDQVSSLHQRCPPRRRRTRGSGSALGTGERGPFRHPRQAIQQVRRHAGQLGGPFLPAPPLGRRQIAQTADDHQRAVQRQRPQMAQRQPTPPPPRRAARTRRPVRHAKAGKAICQARIRYATG